LALLIADEVLKVPGAIRDAIELVESAFQLLNYPPA